MLDAPERQESGGAAAGGPRDVCASAAAAAAAAACHPRLARALRCPPQPSRGRRRTTRVLKGCGASPASTATQPSTPLLPPAMASARPLLCGVVFVAMLTTIGQIMGQPLDVEHRGGSPVRGGGGGGGGGGGASGGGGAGGGGGGDPFLPRFPPGGGSFSAVSQAFSRGGGSAFSKAFSSSGAHAFSNSFAVGPDGDRRLLHQAFSESSSNASREAGHAAGGATRSYSSAGTTADGRVFSESGVEAEGASAASGQRGSQISSQSSASSGLGTLSSASSSSSSSSHHHVAAERGSSSSEALHTGQRVTHLTHVPEVPVLRPVVPIVEELLPTHLDDQFDAILLTTPVPIVEELNFLPINLQPGNAIAGPLTNQVNHRPHHQVPPVNPNDKRRKPNGPIRGYPSQLTNEQQHQQQQQHTSSGSYESHKRGQTAQTTSGMSNSHRESQSSHYSSSKHHEDSPLVLIGYQGNQKPKHQQQHGSSEHHHAGSSHNVHGQRVGAAEMKNIMDSMQSFKTSSHRESHRESHHNKAQDSGSRRTGYGTVMTEDEPEVLYQPQVNNVNGIKESFQQAGNSQGNTNINNIISQMTREAEELNKRPYFAVKNEQLSSKLSESHTRGGSDHMHMRPHLENVDKFVHPEDNTRDRYGDDDSKEDDINESVTYSSESFRSSEAHSEAGSNDEHRSGGRKFLMFNGRRYSSEDLAREFNKTRPSPPPPSSVKPTINQANQAEASTSSYGLELHPDDKQHPRNNHPSKVAPRIFKGSFAEQFGNRYHHFIPPALFDSTEFSKFFFDHFRPGQPVPSASDFAQATAKPPSSFTEAARRPPHLPGDRPTNYFIYPGTIKRESDLPDYVMADLMKNIHGATASSSASIHVSAVSGLASDENPLAGTKIRRIQRVQY